MSLGHGIKDNGYTLRDGYTGFPRSPRVMRSPQGLRKLVVKHQGFQGLKTVWKMDSQTHIALAGHFSVLGPS